MANISKTIDVNGDVDALVQLLVAFVVTTKATVAQGVTLATIPVELEAVLKDLIPAITQLPVVAAGANLADPAFRKALELGLDDVVQALIA